MIVLLLLFMLGGLVLLAVLCVPGVAIRFVCTLVAIVVWWVLAYTLPLPSPAAGILGLCLSVGLLTLLLKHAR